MNIWGTQEWKLAVHMYSEVRLVQVTGTWLNALTYTRSFTQSCKYQQLTSCELYKFGVALVSSSSASEIVNYFLQTI